MQVLREGQARLEGIVRERSREAAAGNDHPGVVRYVRLYRPLRLQQEGMELLVGYLRGLISERARADYDALVDSAAGGRAGLVAVAAQQVGGRGAQQVGGCAAQQVGGRVDCQVGRVACGASRQVWQFSGPAACPLCFPTPSMIPIAAALDLPTARTHVPPPSAGDRGSKADYLGTLTNLFKDVAAAIDEHLELLREAFGPGESA